MRKQLSSSPDPLALSNENVATPSPEKSRGATPTPRKALISTSGNAHIQEFYISTPPARNTSPSKSTKHRAQSTSPWRIRLTVEAEQVDGMRYNDGTKKPSVKRHTECTTTISVPLKGGDDTPSAVGSRGRGRPRKSLEGSVKRSGTPNPKKNARRKTVPESLDKQEDIFSSSTTTPAKKARGRSRKSIEPFVDTSQSLNVKPSMHTSNTDAVNEYTAARKSTRRKSRARRMEITPMKAAIDADIGSGNEKIGLTVDDSMGGCRLDTDVDDLRKTQSVGTFVLGNMSPGKPLPVEQDENMWRAMVRRQSQSPNSSGERKHVREEIDPTNEHQEYDTILESEGFSMVSVSSFASTGSPNATFYNQGGENNVPDNDSASMVSPLVLPPLQKRQKYLEGYDRTPAVVPRPSIPPVLQDAPKQSPRPLEQATDGTPKLARVVRAGTALQGALSPKEKRKLGSPFRSSEKSYALLEVRNVTSQRRHSSPVSKARSPQEELNDLFGNYGAGTRRELKAGLRLGEELAKRQQQNSQKLEIDSYQTGNVSTTDTMAEYSPAIRPEGTRDEHNNASGPSQAVNYPLLSNNQLPSPERSMEDSDEDRMSWKADTPMKSEYPLIVEEQDASANVPPMREPSHHKAADSNTSGTDHTMLAREAEWQREREAVSRCIELANKSQVVVIDSDDDVEASEHDEDEDRGDIWQAEASQSREPSLEAPEILLQSEIVKPRRSKLPSPWRRNSGVVYSDEVEPTEADLFWQPDRSRTRFSKKQVNNCETSADHNIEDSISAPFERPINPVNDHRDKDLLNRTSKVGSSAGSLPAEDVKHKPLISLHTSGPMHTEGFSSLLEQDDTVLEDDNSMIDDLPVSDLVPAVYQVPVSNSNAVDVTAADGLVDPPEDIMAAIDPFLLQKPAKKSTKRQVRKPAQKQVQERIQAPAQKRSSAIVPLNVADTQTSWMTRLTAPIWRALKSLPPPATKEDILCSGPHEPLCQFTPWEGCHFRALQPLYYASLLYGSHIFPFNRCHLTAAYLGMKIETQGGWSRTITEADCGVTDAFMVLLEGRGFALAGQPGERWIDEGLVVKQCIALWVEMVMKGEVEVDPSKGEKAGLRKEGDRLWTKDDIDWSHNRSEYLERKKRDFDGLPSWKAKGIQWR